MMSQLYKNTPFKPDNNVEQNLRIGWQEGTRFKVSAEKAYEEIEKLNHNFGGYAPDGELVKISSKPNAVLHSLFEWDNTVAANTYRLQTEKKIKRSLIVCEESPKDGSEPMMVRIYQRASLINEDDNSRKRVWMSTFDMLNDEEGRKQLLENARRELKSFVKKYDQLEELSDLINPITKFLKN